MIEPGTAGKPGFVMCADDFALTAGVSRGILELLAAGRISATGAMTNRPHWRVFAPELMAFSGKADLGVHLNLTCAEPLGVMASLAPDGRFPALGTLARAAVTSRHACMEIGGEIRRQLDAFEDAAERAPDFVDGHQHVHALPGIRGQVIEAIRSRYPAGTVYLRDPSDKAAAILRRNVATGKALAVAAMACGLAGQAKAAFIPVNQGFSGFSAFDPARDFAADMAHSLESLGRRHLVMCHPGHVDDELGQVDPVTTTRSIEWAMLAKTELKGMCRFAML